MSTSDDDYWQRIGPEVDWILRQLRRLRVPESDLDDLTQEVLIAVYGRWRDYDRTRSLRGWLFGFAFRIASDHRRRRMRREAVMGLAASEQLPTSGPDPERAAERGDDRRRLLRALDELDDDRRAVLVLVDLEEFTVPEAATALDIPLNTAYSRLRVARERLVASLRDARSKEGSDE